MQYNSSPIVRSALILATHLFLATAPLMTSAQSLVFVSDRDGNLELYTTNPGSASATRITNSALADISPQWSPSGSRIAFSRSTHTWTVAPNGTDLVGPLGTDVDRALSPTWSPDGLRLAAQVSEDFSGGDDWEIYTMEPDGSDLQPLTVNTFQDRYPSWSPDGARIAFSRDNVLTIIDSTTGADIQAYPGAGTARYPAWSPSGDRIAFSRLGAGWNLAVLDVASGIAANIVADGNNNFWPAWSPDGTQLVYTTQASGEDYDIVIVDDDGGNPTPQPFNSESDDSHPHWRAGIVIPDSLTVPLITRSKPEIDGRVAFGEWLGREDADAAVLELTNGQMVMLHDDTRLYLLIDMLADDTDDPADLGGGDEYWLLFDVDGDGAITGNLDRRYRLDEFGQLRFETFMPGAVDLESFNPLSPGTHSARAEGFGCFVGDGTLGLLPYHCEEHRIWEVALDLFEITQIPASEELRDHAVPIGVMVRSGAPDFEERVPGALEDPESYLPLVMQDRIGLRGGQFDNGLQPLVITTFQAIEPDGAPLDLVAGKQTQARIRLGQKPDHGGALVSLHGRRDSIDLPGSPLLEFGYKNVHQTDEAYVLSGPTMVLPKAWTDGDISLSVQVRQPWINSAGALSPVDLQFTPTQVPEYWIVPFNTGTPEMPEMMSDDNLKTHQLAAVSVLPLTRIRFTRRPVVVDDPPTKAEFKQLLNQYMTNTFLAYGDGLATNGTPPFELPDQLVGTRRFGLGNASGSSDPHWFGGNANVVWISQDLLDDMLLPHELNHNLDRRPIESVTWGRHVSNVLEEGDACDTEDSGDSGWPYSNDNIQTFGWAMKPGYELRQVYNTYSDFMSYCRGGRPSAWISPYRWQALFELFAAATRDPASADLRGPPAEVLYVSGQVHDDDSGELDPVTVAPGEPQLPAMPGDYEIRLHACNEAELAAYPFHVSFMDVENQPDEMVSFSFILPDPGGVCSVRLYLEDVLLGQIDVSDNAPAVTLTSPNGGEDWAGEEMIAWSWSDVDADPLTATLLYTTDDGAAWLPIASGISGTSIVVDSANLPGNPAARIKIIVTDGYNTVSDSSDGTFSVSAKPPTVSILSPADGERVTNGAAVVFQGTAWAAEGFSIAEEQLLWTLDGEEMGTGESTSAHLNIGVYEVGLAVLEGNSVVAQDSAIFEVFDAINIFGAGFEAPEPE